MKKSRAFLAIVWLAFIGYAVWFSPEGNGPYLKQLLSMDSPDPLLLAVFSLLGVFPMLYASLLLRMDNGAVPAWPFVAGSFFLGAFALLPYYIIASDQPKRTLRTPSWLLTIITSSVFLGLLTLAVLALVGYGVTTESFVVYQEAFQTSQFVHIMTIDFFVLYLLSIYGAYFHVQQSGQRAASPFLAIIPILGLIGYLFLQNRKNNE
ncbi:hypothetical protein [Thalassobacillus hwangdonensis]|uniref:DUF2834 domain-containing protein n=1 Tax=Thalassobacillus hwangdonensis TaxID=546108 RepID=A0ABW3L2G4_9BACI